MLEIGAHHVWWPFLQALFMIAKPLPAMSSTSATINKGAFIYGLRYLRRPPTYPFAQLLALV